LHAQRARFGNWFALASPASIVAALLARLVSRLISFAARMPSTLQLLRWPLAARAYGLLNNAGSLVLLARRDNINVTLASTTLCGEASMCGGGWRIWRGRQSARFTRRGVWFSPVTPSSSASSGALVFNNSKNKARMLSAWFRFFASLLALCGLARWFFLVQQTAPGVFAWFIGGFLTKLVCRSVSDVTLAVRLLAKELWFAA
jgi:hypothetical protein